MIVTEVTEVAADRSSRLDVDVTVHARLPSDGELLEVLVQEATRVAKRLRRSRNLPLLAAAKLLIAVTETSVGGVVRLLDGMVDG